MTFALYELKKRAVEGGYEPTVALVIYNLHVGDTESSGRPGVSLKKQQEIVANYGHGREKSTVEIAAKVEVSQSLVTQRKWT